MSRDLNPGCHYRLLLHVQSRYLLEDDGQHWFLQTEIGWPDAQLSRILLHVLETTIGGAQGHLWQTYQALGTKYVSPSDQPSPTSLAHPAPWLKGQACADRFRPWRCAMGHADFIHRAAELEKELGFQQYSTRPPAGIITGRNAMKAFFLIMVLFGVISLFWFPS